MKHKVFTALRWGFIGARFVLLFGGIVVAAWRWTGQRARRSGSAAARPAPARLRALKKPDDVAVGVFDSCDQPSATDILVSVQDLDP